MLWDGDVREGEGGGGVGCERRMSGEMVNFHASRNLRPSELTGFVQQRVCCDAGLMEKNIRRIHVSSAVKCYQVLNTCMLHKEVIFNLKLSLSVYPCMKLIEAGDNM